MTTPQHASRRHPSRGLTLIELMMAVAVAAILLALAAPSFTQAIAKSRLTTAASELTSALQLARAEAIRANRRVVLCRSEDGSSCKPGTGSWSGWIVFVDTDGDGVRDGNEPVVKAGTIDGPLQALSSAAISANGERVTFRGDGLARASNGQSLMAGTVALCLNQAGVTDNVRDVSLAFGSRTTVHKRAATGCNAPGDTL